MAHTFKGGIHPGDMKEGTAHKPIEPLTPPDYVVLPVSMHIGAPCEPTVKVGDYVYLGQKVADSAAMVSSPVHASISGTVKEVALKPHPNGSRVLSIVIENDFKDEPDPAMRQRDPDQLSDDEIIELIRDAGIVGHGGAMFPTHVKIRSAVGKVDTILINGAECEPYITSDHRIMLEYPWEIIGGIQILQKLLKVPKAYLGVESNKSNAFEPIKKHLPQNGSVELVPLTVKYPQGAEKQLITSLTGREVPSGKLPADAGCAVFNVDTAAAVYRLFVTGSPALRRIVTVSGSAIATPKNLEVRIGTPIANLIASCGGLIDPPKRMLMGGPMMGVPLFTDEAPVIKGTNAILAFCRDEVETAKNPVCIRCGKCVGACPMHLMPTYIYLSSIAGDMDACEKYGAQDCIECGSCSFTCPGKLPLLQGIRNAKQEVLSAIRARRSEV